MPGAPALAIAGAALAFAAVARAQCDAGIVGDPPGTLEESFPADGARSVPTNSPVRLRFVVAPPASASVCVRTAAAPPCLSGTVRTTGTDLSWVPDAPLAALQTYIVQYADRAGGAVATSFTTGRGAAGAPLFAGITSASVDPASDACDPGAMDVTVRFDRISGSSAAISWPESDIEYLVYETRGPGISGPRLRDRTRLESSGSTFDVTAQRTIRLAAREATGPACFAVQAADPLGRVLENSAEACVDPAQGNYFHGCATPPAPRRNGLSSWGFAAVVLAACGRRARTRR